MVRAHQTLWPPSQLGARAVEINGILSREKKSMTDFSTPGTPYVSPSVITLNSQSHNNNTFQRSKRWAIINFFAPSVWLPVWADAASTTPTVEFHLPPRVLSPFVSQKKRKGWYECEVLFQKKKEQARNLKEIRKVRA